MKNSKANALIHEKSPYLLQHAYNPIQWQSWNALSLEEAINLDKPIFLSIGYSTCHWCHVMEEESFSNKELADFFNANFICIKVDREERTDLDHLYMKACQAITGKGGWPLNCFLTPQLKPFFASTYLPLEDAYQLPGLKRLGFAIAEIWKNQREKVEGDAQALYEGLVKSYSKETSDELPAPSQLENCSIELESRYDLKHGGFDKAPKFPNSQNLLYLLYRFQFQPDGMKESILFNSLHNMVSGGLFDHIGGGFMRYSTDANWQIPHFEKMLYDNAQMLLLYSEAFTQLETPLFKWVAENTAMYILRDLQSSEGGFYCAEDADSQGKEGYFYTWEYNELKEALAKDFIQFESTYDISIEGNFNLAGHDSLRNNHLVWKPTFTKIVKMGQVQTLYELESFREPLLKLRNKRERPFRDEKILCDWNGLVMASLAKSGRLLGELLWVEKAQALCQFLEAKLVQGDYLYHRYYEDEVAIKSCLDDYAFFIWGLIELNQSTGDNSYLHKAIDWTDKTIEYFFNSDTGFFFYSLDNQNDLIIRSSEIFDGAIPSGNSAMANNLVKLFHLTAKPEYKTVIEKQFCAMKSTLEEHSSSHCLFMSALDHYYIDAPQISIYNLKLDEREDREKFLDELSTLHQLKNPRILFQFPEKNHPKLPLMIKESLEQRTFERYALCKNKTCFPPTSDFELLKDLFNGKF